MLTGMLPWNENSSIVGLYNKIKKDPVVFPKNMKICKDLQELVKGMLTVDEEKRLNAIEVCEGLAKI